MCRNKTKIYIWCLNVFSFPVNNISNAEKKKKHKIWNRIVLLFLYMFCDTFWCIVISWNWDALFWAMIFMDLWWMFWALKILFFSLWNSPVTSGRTKVMGVVIRNPGEIYCLNDQGHWFCDQDLHQSMVLLWFWDSSRNCRGPYCVFEGWEMHVYCTLIHACRDSQQCKE